MLRARWFAGVALGVVLAIASGAHAQTPGPVELHRGSLLSAGGGIASAVSETRPTVSGTFGWELTTRMTIEGTGLWLDHGAGMDGFAAQLGGTFHLVPAGAHRVAPYVGAGFGFYRASLDLGARGFQSDGPQTVPRFYARRLGEAGTPVESRSFTDPAYTLGAGATISLTRHLVMRPDVRMIAARADGLAHRVAVFSVNLGYRFHARPIQKEVGGRR